jgi:phage-related minor tail protein
LLKVETDAEATELRLGDGTAEFIKRRIELDKEFATNRLSVLAYNNALVEAKQKEQDLADQSTRTANDIGSLAAGFDQAARAYAKSNDMFATGGQLFTGITTSMTESLDVLVGTSTKSWQQIALGFTQMLEKMALQAALSPVFKMISGAITSAISPVTISSIIEGLPAMAGGGPVSAGQPYVVGEKGPELFVPGAAGTIQPAGAGSGGGITVNVAMGSTQGTGSVDPSSALAFGRKLKTAISDVIQNEQRPGGMLYSRVTG